MKLSEIKKDIQKNVNFNQDVELAVKIYECEYEEYTVEILVYINDEFAEGYNIETYEELKEARKKASYVKSVVKKWFDPELCEVDRETELYHV